MSKNIGKKGSITKNKGKSLHYSALHKLVHYTSPNRRVPFYSSYLCYPCWYSSHSTMQAVQADTVFPDGALCHIFYSSPPNCIKDEISYIGKPCTLDGYYSLVQTINASYWECKSENTCQTKGSTSLSSNSASKGNSSGSSDSKEKSKEKDNKSKSWNNESKSFTGSSSGISKSSKTASHLEKDGKLTKEGCQHRIKEKLCMFCGQPGQMAKDCHKFTSKSSKAKAHAAKAETPTAAESKKKKSAAPRMNPLLHTLTPQHYEVHAPHFPCLITRDCSPKQYSQPCATSATSDWD